MKSTHADPAAKANTYGQTRMCLRHRSRLRSGKGHAGISPLALGKATRKPASCVCSSLRPNIGYAKPM